MSDSEINFKIQDEGRLAELGYTQELRREWSLLHNFGVSFSIIVSTSHPRTISDHNRSNNVFVLQSPVTGIAT